MPSKHIEALHSAFTKRPKPEHGRSSGDPSQGRIKGLPETSARRHCTRDVGPRRADSVRSNYPIGRSSWNETLLFRGGIPIRQQRVAFVAAEQVNRPTIENSAGSTARPDFPLQFPLAGLSRSTNPARENIELIVKPLRVQYSRVREKPFNLGRRQVEIRTEIAAPVISPRKNLNVEEFVLRTIDSKFGAARTAKRCNREQE